MNLIRRCVGINGVVELYSDHLKITRPGGCLTSFVRGETMIAYSKLSAVQYKPASTMGTGFVEFIFAGSLETSRDKWGASLQNKNTVVFGFKEQTAFEYARDFVQDRILHPAPEASKPQSAPSEDPLAYLEKLAKLRDQGIVTNEEFEAKKRRILGM